MSNIMISLAAEFVGKKAFDQAGKSTTSLEKSVKKLGKTLGLSLSAAAVVAYGRASVKAFAADEAAAQRLTTAVNNLGLSFAAVEVSSFISNLEKSANVADDSLRPAFQALLTTTKSLTQSQKLLSLAIETSRGSGIELTTVAKDIGMAYVGNTRGLRKYNLGLTQAELKTIKFTEVQERLNKQFTGANAAYLDTTAGKLEAIGLASDRLSESIGGALVSAFVAASGSSGVEDLIKKIDSLASKITKFGDGLERFAYKVKVAFSFEGLTGGQDYIDKQLVKFDNKKFLENDPRIQQYNAIQASKQKVVAEKKAAEYAKTQSKLSKTTLTNQLKITADQKRSAITKKQSALLDIEQIQLVAALQGKISQEDRDRVKLQLALLTGNTTEADRLSQKIAMSIDSTGKLGEYLRTLPDANNPFLGWDTWLVNFTKNLAAATGAKVSADGSLMPANNNTVLTNVPVNYDPRVSIPEADRKLYPGQMQYGPRTTQPSVVVQIDGKEIAAAVLNQSLNGVSSIDNRLNGSFK